MSFRIDSITNYFSSLTSCVIKPLQSYITLVAYKAFPSFKQLETDKMSQAKTIDGLKGQNSKLVRVIAKISAMFKKAITENRALKEQLSALGDLMSARSTQIEGIEAQLEQVRNLLAQKDATIARQDATIARQETEIVALKSPRGFSGPQ